jgi:hypothetical protein
LCMGRDQVMVGKYASNSTGGPSAISGNNTPGEYLGMNEAQRHQLLGKKNA